MNERIINHLASKYKGLGVSFEDLKSEAIMLALQAEKSFSPEKGGSIDTWQYICIKNGLRDFVRKEMEWNNQICDMEVGNEDDEENKNLDSFIANPDHSDVLDGISNEAKMVCSAIFNAPNEYLSIMPKMARGVLVKKCREEFGWSWPKIWKTMAELKGAVS